MEKLNIEHSVAHRVIKTIPLLQPARAVWQQILSGVLVPGQNACLTPLEASCGPAALEGICSEFTQGKGYSLKFCLVAQNL